MEVTRHIFSKVIMQNDIFHDKNVTNETLLEFVLQRVTTTSYPPEDVIIKQGNDANELYFLSKGECEVLVKNEYHIESLVRILKEGALFGEVGLIANGRRTATITCLNYCTCAALSLVNFREMCRQFPETYNKLKEKRKKYKDKWKQFLRRLVLSIEYFQGLSENSIDELIYSL